MTQNYLQNNKSKLRVRKPYVRMLLWFILTGFLLAGFGVASIVDTNELVLSPPLKPDSRSTSLLLELDQLGLLKDASQSSIEKLLSHQKKTGQSLAKIFRSPEWQDEFGLSGLRFKSTWYAANPFDLLPNDLQKAIRQKKIPMTSSKKIYEWCRINKAPSVWVRSLKAALRETTPANLARAAQGKRPFARNGQLLQPLVVERGSGRYEIQSGHIATDPRIIPTNTDVIMLVRIDGKERLLKVKAADTGGAIRGYHVDLPIQFKTKPEIKHFPHISFPNEYIGNPSVMIFLKGKVNRGQKA